MAIEPVAHVIDNAQPNIITEIMLAEVEQTALKTMMMANGT
jgi:hypothetical protein